MSYLSVYENSPRYNIFLFCYDESCRYRHSRRYKQQRKMSQPLMKRRKKDIVDVNEMKELLSFSAAKPVHAIHKMLNEKIWQCRYRGICQFAENLLSTKKFGNNDLTAVKVNKLSSMCFIKCFELFLFWESRLICNHGNKSHFHH